MKDKSMLWKWLLLVGLCVWSLMMALPLNEKVQLGIDLSGGYRFVLGVDYDQLQLPEGQEKITEADRERAQDQALEVLRNRIDSAGTKEAIVYKEPGTGRIVFEIPAAGEEERKELEDMIKRPAYLEFALVHEENSSLVSEFMATGEVPVGYEAVTVDGSRYFQEIKDFEWDETKRAQLELTGRISPRYRFMMQRVDVENYNELYYPIYVEVRPELDGTAIKSSRPDRDPTTFLPVVSLEMNSEGAKRFFQITKDYVANGEKNPSPVGRRLAIIMDSTLYSAPTLQAVIPNGRAEISGMADIEEATSLSNALNSGALPVPIEVLMQQQVDPTLGKDSINSGMLAGLIGLALVVVFMLVYYMMAGVVVNVALVLDAILLPLGMFLAAGFLGIFGSGGGAGAVNINALPTLTLYGIAGLVLTIGMAVDANVLIFERIREEQKAGKRFVSAVSSGFEKAFSTIFDANITTLLVAVILYMQGSGPIRGFSVMLTAGIIVSMYTALVFTRMGFDVLIKSGVERVKMLSILPDNLSVDFLSKDKIALGISAVLIVASLVNIGRLGSDVLGIDFTGGSSLSYSYSLDDGVERPSEDDLRSALSAAGVGESVIQYQQLVQGSGAASGDRLQVRVDSEFTELTQETLETQFGESHGFSQVGIEQIGSQVSDEMAGRGLRAILLALVGIVIYITIRFEFAFAMGTIAALAHDVLLTVGLYCLFGRQLSLPIVAALLTIVGYSANDTIVVFDRIREDLKLLKGKPYREIANISINQTLSRTLLTSLTTLITVVMLLVFGGGAINDFALALCIGVLVGTYSSIFVATPVMLLWHRGEKTLKD